MDEWYTKTNDKYTVMRSFQCDRERGEERSGEKEEREREVKRRKE